MGDVFCKGESWKVIKPTTIAWLKMEDVYKLCNVIEIFHWNKVTKTKRRKRYNHFKLQMTLAQLCKTHLLIYENIQIPPLLKGGIDWQGVLFIYVLLKKYHVDYLKYKFA
jgi:hypothetical protein